MMSTVLEVAGLVAVVFASFLDLQRLERIAPEARPRPSLAARCPYCHLVFEDGDGAVERCRACATSHHHDCWSEHGGCSVFGCGARALASDAPG